MLRRNTPALPLHIVLLLVALFNALAGAPLHEAQHIQELVRSATVSASAGDVDALTNNATASDEHSEETHTTCAWCLTHALEAGLGHAPARPPQLPAEPNANAPHSANPRPPPPPRRPGPAPPPSPPAFPSPPLFRFPPCFPPGGGGGGPRPCAPAA